MTNAEIAFEFKERNTKTVKSLLSAEYLNGYEEGIEHYLDKQDNKSKVWVSFDEKQPNDGEIVEVKSEKNEVDIRYYLDIDQGSWLEWRTIDYKKRYEEMAEIHYTLKSKIRNLLSSS